MPRYETAVVRERRLGVQARRLEQAAVLRHWRARGASWVRIVRETGWSRSVIREVARQAGLTQSARQRAQMLATQPAEGSA